MAAGQRRQFQTNSATVIQCNLCEPAGAPVPAVHYVCIQVLVAAAHPRVNLQRRMQPERVKRSCALMHPDMHPACTLMCPHACALHAPYNAAAAADEPSTAAWLPSDALLPAAQPCTSVKRRAACQPCSTAGLHSSYQLPLPQRKQMYMLGPTGCPEKLGSPRTPAWQSIPRWWPKRWAPTRGAGTTARC